MLRIRLGRILLSKSNLKSHFFIFVLIGDRKIGQKKRKKIEANSIQCSQAVTHPSTDWTQHCLTSVIGRELVYSMWYGRWHLKGANSHFFNLSHHYRKGSWNLKTGLKTQFSFSFCLLQHQGKSNRPVSRKTPKIGR